MKLSRTLTINMSGEDIAYLQTKLKNIGFFNGRISGYFGQDTLLAITNFQRDVGMKVNGTVNSLVWNKLNNYGKIITKEPEIVHEISYTTPNGLTIYDSLISEDDYYKDIVKKDIIWLHHSEGGSRPDWTISGWEKEYLKDVSGKLVSDSKGNSIPLKVGKAYVIGRKSSTTDDTSWDGKILRAFDDKYYAYHLGINSANSKDLNSRSIAIEICNYGPLTIGKDGRFYNYVNKPINEKEVVKLDKPFRGYEYFERYTDAQIENLRKLLIYLINKHSIKIEGKIYNEKWFEYNTKLSGIKSHSNMRVDKYDIFPQKEMIQMLNSI